MKKSGILLLSLVVLTRLLLPANSIKAFPALRNSLMAGTAKINITPRTPIPMSGYGGRNDPFKGIHDDLFARAIVLGDGRNKAVIISMELIGVSNTFWKDVTEALEKKTGIKKEFVLLSAVHNHDGPVTNVYEEYDAPEVLAYIAELKEKMVKVTLEAIRNMAPVSLGVGKGECKMNINRRAQNGKGEITLGLNPYGPCDHEVGVISVVDMAGKPLAVLMNWPCHAVVLGPRNYLISGDWPGAASAYVEKSADGNFIAPVFVGASGNINPLYGPHIDFESNSDYAFGKDAIGEDLGKESLRVAKDLKTFSSATISASQRIITLPAKEKEKTSKLTPGSSENDSLKVRLSVLKIGNIILTGVSGEVFNEISVKMRSQSPYAFTFMITHCNGSSGYLITDAAYSEGGYEANTTRAKSGAEKAIVESLLSMINELGN